MLNDSTANSEILRPATPVNRLRLYGYFLVICIQTMAAYFIITLIDDRYMNQGVIELEAYYRMKSIASNCAMVSGIVAGMLAKYGRRKLLIGCNICTNIMLVLALTMDSTILQIAYIMSESFRRILMVNTLIFIKEIVPLSPSTGIIIVPVMANLGLLFADIAGALFIDFEKDKTDQFIYIRSTIVILGILPCLAQLGMLIWYFPYESTLYLIEKGEYEKTLSAIKLFCPDEERANELIEKAKEKVSVQKSFSVTWRQFLSKTYVLPFIVCGTLMFLKNLCYFYSTELFIYYLYVMDFPASELEYEVYTCISCTAPFICIWLIKRFHPRTILLTACLIIGIFIQAIYWLSVIFAEGGEGLRELLIVLHAIKDIVYYATVSPLVYVYFLKVLPDKAIGLVYACFWLAGKADMALETKWYDQPETLGVWSIGAGSIVNSLNFIIIVLFLDKDMKHKWRIAW